LRLATGLRADLDTGVEIRYYRYEWALGSGPSCWVAWRGGGSAVRLRGLAWAL